MNNTKAKSIFNLLGFIIIMGLFTTTAASTGSNYGLEDGLLKPCPAKPSYLCSEYPDTKNYVVPWSYSGSSEQVWESAKSKITALGGTIEIIDNTYLHATFRSRIFGFIAAFELRLDEANKRMHVRSASRSGY